MLARIIQNHCLRKAVWKYLYTRKKLGTKPHNPMCHHSKVGSWSGRGTENPYQVRWISKIVHNRSISSHFICFLLSRFLAQFPKYYTWYPENKNLLTCVWMCFKPFWIAYLPLELRIETNWVLNEFCQEIIFRNFKFGHVTKFILIFRNNLRPHE